MTPQRHQISLQRNGAVKPQLLPIYQTGGWTSPRTVLKSPRPTEVIFNVFSALRAAPPWPAGIFSVRDAHRVLRSARRCVAAALRTACLVMPPLCDNIIVRPTRTSLRGIRRRYGRRCHSGSRNWSRNCQTTRSRSGKPTTKPRGVCFCTNNNDLHLSHQGYRCSHKSHWSNCTTIPP